MIEDRSEDHWQGFVYDPHRCEVLYTAARQTVERTMFAVLDYAAVHAFGPAHHLDLPLLAELLHWDLPTC